MSPADAASGLDEGNAGADTSMTLGQALTAALDGQAAGAGATNNGDIDDVMTNPDVARLAEGAKGQQSAGEDRGGEDAAAAEPADGTAAKDGASDGQPAAALAAPKHWPDADKQAFAKLPAEGQQTILKLAKNLEGGFTRKSQELSDKAKFADTVRGLFDDTTRQQLRRAGTDEVGAVQYLIKLQNFATQRPAEYIVWAMQNMKVRPEDIGLTPQSMQAAGAGAGQPGDKAAPSGAGLPATTTTGDPKLDELLKDPAVEQLRSELMKANQQIESLTGKMTQRERAEYEYAQRVEYQRQQQQQAETNNVLRLVSDFRSEIGDDGQLAFPHFDQVYQRMGAIMDTVPSIRKMPDGKEKMAAAYRYVVNGDPELSQAQQAALIEAEVTKRMAAAAKKAEADRAKRAAGVQPARGAPTARTRATNLDDAIAGAFTSRGF